MNLTTFNNLTLPAALKAGKKRPFLSINPKSGVFRFNKAAVEAFGLGPGTSVAFHRDKDSPLDLYVEFNPAENGYPLQTPKDEVSIRFGHRSLAETITGILSATDTIEVPIGPKDEKTNFCALITKAVRPSANALRTSQRKH